MPPVRLSIPAPPMNYINHTRAAHEKLRHQPDARPHHVSLYWALFFQWNASHFATQVELDHAATMQAAHIGNERTYRAALYDLDTWGLLHYAPSQSRHQPSRCQLANLSGAEVPPVKPATRGRSAPDKTPLSGAEVPEALGAEVSPIGGLSGAEVPEDTLLSKTSFKTPLQNVSGGTKKKPVQQVSVQEQQTEEGMAAPGSDRLGAAPKDAAHQTGRVAPKRKGVKQATIRAAAHSQATAAPTTRAGSRRAPRPEIPFEDSELASYEAFAAAFAGTDYELADLRFYHAKVRAWRQKGQIPHRADWKATAEQFFLNDAHVNRLKLAPGVQSVKPGTDPRDPNHAGIPTTGYRSSRWD